MGSPHVRLVDRLLALRNCLQQFSVLSLQVAKTPATNNRNHARWVIQHKYLSWFLLSLLVHGFHPRCQMLFLPVIFSCL